MRRFKKVGNNVGQFIQEVDNNGSNIGKPIEALADRAAQIEKFALDPNNANYTFIDSEAPIRKAGAEITPGMLDDIIDSEIRREVKAALGDKASNDVVEAIVDSSMEDLQPGGNPIFERSNLNALAKMNKRLVKAGVSIDDLGGGTGGLHSITAVVGRLQGDVPGPYMMKGKQGQEVRLHLVDEDIGKGVRGVVPYMDPSNLKQPLKTTYGDVRGTAAAYYDNPSEYVGAQALKLMGMEAGIGNQDDVRGRSAHWRSDLVNNATGKRIDVERGDVALDKKTLPLQLTAVLRPKGGTSGRSYDEGANALVRYAGANNINSLIDAVEGIRGTQYAYNNPDRFYYGKGFKTADQGYSPEDRIDQILSLEYGKGANRKDAQGITVAPKDINMINVPETMAYIDQLGANFSTTGNSPIRVQSIDYADSAGGKQDKRSKVKANVRKGGVVREDDKRRGVTAGSPINYNVVDSSPLTRQLLEKLPYLK